MLEINLFGFIDQIIESIMKIKKQNGDMLAFNDPKV